MSAGCSDLSLGRKEWMGETEGDSWALGVREQRQIKTRSRSDLDVEDAWHLWKPRGSSMQGPVAFAVEVFLRERSRGGSDVISPNK